MVRDVKMLQALFLVLLSFVAGAQERIKGVSPCVDSVINSLQTHTIYQPVKVKATDKKLTLKCDKTQKAFKQDAVLSWMNKIEKDSIKAYELNSTDLKCYVFSSYIKRATGLAINFTSWLIVVPKSNFILEFESLVQNNRLIYFDKQTNKLIFIRFTYGDSFFWNRDWDNVNFKMELNEIDNGSVKAISSKDSKCPEN
ncbi:MAG: hypothetical protein U1C46_01610 [Bacteroidales bacterium]|nr:hypothetical protein [Bacteroidales bacterium]